jgi:hypothetical protein
MGADSDAGRADDDEDAVGAAFGLIRAPPHPATVATMQSQASCLMPAVRQR